MKYLLYILYSAVVIFGLIMFAFSVDSMVNETPDKSLANFVIGFGLCIFGVAGIIFATKPFRYGLVILSNLLLLLFGLIIIFLEVDNFLYGESIDPLSGYGLGAFLILVGGHFIRREFSHRIMDEGNSSKNTKPVINTKMYVPYLFLNFTIFIVISILPLSIYLEYSENQAHMSNVFTVVSVSIFGILAWFSHASAIHQCDSRVPFTRGFKLALFDTLTYAKIVLKIR